MGLVDRLMKSVRGEPSEFTYECRACKEVFTSRERNMGEVACPNCGDFNIRQRAA